MNPDSAAAAFQKVAADAKAAGFSVDELVALFPTYAASIRDVAAAQGVTNLSSQELADWMGGRIPQAVTDAAAANRAFTAENKALYAAMEDATTATSRHEAALLADAEAARKSANAALAASGGMIGLEAAIDQATASVRENKATLDLNTEAGRANRTALDGIAAAGLSAADGLNEAGASSDEVAKAQQRAYDQFIKVAGAMGLDADKAADLAREYGLIPGEVETEVSATGAKSAKTDVDNLRDSLNGLKDQTVYVHTIYDTTGAPRTNAKGVNRAYAGGGRIVGEGTATSDSTLIAASNGEYMLREWAARRLGIDRLNYMNETGQIPKFATGGEIGGNPYTTSRTYTAPSWAASGGGVVTVDLTAIAGAVRDGLASSHLSLSVPGMVGLVDARIVSVSQASDMAIRTGGVGR